MHNNPSHTGIGVSTPDSLQLFGVRQYRRLKTVAVVVSRSSMHTTYLTALAILSTAGSLQLRAASISKLPQVTVAVVLIAQ
jgi:hypothetical protein